MELRKNCPAHGQGAVDGVFWRNSSYLSEPEMAHGANHVSGSALYIFHSCAFNFFSLFLFSTLSEQSSLSFYFYSFASLRGQLPVVNQLSQIFCSVPRTKVCSFLLLCKTVLLRTCLKVCIMPSLSPFAFILICAEFATIGSMSAL